MSSLSADVANPYTDFFSPYAFLSHYFIDASNLKTNNQLRSKDFLQNFKDYIDGIANLDSTQKQNFGYSSLSDVDNLIDQYLAFYNNNLVSINQTPNKVLAQIGKTRILHYFSNSNETTTPSSTKDAMPLLMVYAPINRYHILDLSPNRSIVNKFVSAGFDIFLIDWGEEQSKDKLTISDYIDDMDQALEIICKATKKEKINLYGYSWGGTLCLIYCALHNSKIQSLILQSANLDFDKDDTVIAEWMRNFPVEKFNDEFEEMFGHLIDLAFLMRNPVVHSTDRLKYALDTKEYDIFQFVQNLAKISAWITNTPDLSGQLFRQFVIDLYQKNLLLKNQLSIEDKGKVNGQKEITLVDLKKITIPILNVIGSNDDLVSPKSSIPINDTVSSKDKKTIEFPSGHIELCISYDAHRHLWPEVVDWLQSKSDTKNK
ncbi:MAG TPA: alpha/beta fold hydrolase [Candidatus Saccharimonadales bacterium]|nr:alpha/beta fold hydrolase [Candidatus Saccharimonadales bacterium]